MRCSLFAVSSSLLVFTVCDAFSTSPFTSDSISTGVSPRIFQRAKILRVTLAKSEKVESEEQPLDRGLHLTHICDPCRRIAGGRGFTIVLRKPPLTLAE
jgi:hypothetical protein